MLFVEVSTPWSWLRAAAYPVYIDPTFTDGYGGDVTTYKDGGINAGAATTNYGSAQTSNIGYPGSIWRTLIEFDVSSLSGVTINTATLTLTPNSVDTPGTYDAYNVLTPWTAAGMTWNTSDGSTSWPSSAGCGTAGTDHSATKIFDSISSWAGGTAKNISLDTTQVTNWLTTNYGLIIIGQNKSTWNNVQMAMADHTNTAYRPMLVVDYTAGGGATLTVNNVSQAQTVGNVALTQHNVLSVDNILQAQSVDAPALTQHNALAVDNVNQSQAVDAPALTQHNVLAVGNIAQAQAIGNVDLVQYNMLAVDNIAQAQAVGSIALVEHHVLTVKNIAQAQAIGQANLTYHAPGAAALIVQNVDQAQAVGAADLVQHNVLTVANVAQAQAVGAVVVVYHAPAGIALIVANVNQVQSVGPVALTQHHILTVANVAQAQTIDAVSFVLLYLDLTLSPRSTLFTLKDRSTLFTLKNRSVDWTLKDRT